MRARRLRSLGTLAGLALTAVLAGCGSASSSSASAAPSATNASVAIVNFAFKPADITVKAGTKVTFTNHDATAHTATSRTPGFDTGTLKPGASATVTVSRPGTYSYYCQFHAFMVAKLTVVE